MEDEKTVIIQLRLTRTHRFLALALAFLCFHPRPLGSETLTLTAYYPAPYGAYVSLLTTQTTLLARDSGVVGVGTETPDANAKIDIVGGGIYMDDGEAIYNRGVMNMTGVGALNLKNNGGTVISNDDGGTGNLLVEGTLDVQGTGVLNVCERKTYRIGSSESCTAGFTIVGFIGDGLGKIVGFVPADGNMSGPGFVMSFGQDWAGTFVCCKFKNAAGNSI